MFWHICCTITPFFLSPFPQFLIRAHVIVCTDSMRRLGIQIPIPMASVALSWCICMCRVSRPDLVRTQVGPTHKRYGPLFAGLYSSTNVVGNVRGTISAARLALGRSDRLLMENERISRRLPSPFAS